ncbi:hypothetical protein C2E23DRAFT_882653 [Lenzites betulinus]|nr:hypothetical protein C2E23DRAFT_882653 [Lenzites betulinus]
MRAFASVYEEPAFEEPSTKERSVFYAVVGAAVTIASTVAAIQINGAPGWLSHAQGTHPPQLVILRLRDARADHAPFAPPTLQLLSLSSHHRTDVPVPVHDRRTPTP